MTPPAHPAPHPSPSFGQAAPPPPRGAPLIVDTDIGDNIDDTWALLLLAAQPGLDLKLVVTSTGDTRLKARLAAKVLASVGRSDISVAPGVPTKEGAFNQARWLGEFQLGDYPGDVYDDGIAAMVDCIATQDVPPTVLALGPQTNLAAALVREPRIAQRARVVATAGSIYSGYGGLARPCAEANVLKDVPAARAVLEAPWHNTWAPLDICGAFALDAAAYAAVRASNAPQARVAVENFEQWSTRDALLVEGTSILYDALAACLVLGEEWCNVVEVPLRITDQGYTRVDEAGRPVRCALSWKDRASFERWVVASLTGPMPRAGQPGARTDPLAVDGAEHK